MIGLSSFVNGVGAQDLPTYFYSNKSLALEPSANSLTQEFYSIRAVGPEYDPYDPEHLYAHYYWEWLAIPRSPTISEDWKVQVQHQPTYQDPLDRRFSGDIYVENTDTGISFKLTNSKSCNHPDLYGDLLVYEEALNLVNDPNDNYQIYLADLSSVNLATIDPITHEPAFVNTICISGDIAMTVASQIANLSSYNTGDFLTLRKSDFDSKNGRLYHASLVSVCADDCSGWIRRRCRSGQCAEGYQN